MSGDEHQAWPMKQDTDRLERAWRSAVSLSEALDNIAHMNSDMVTSRSGLTDEAWSTFNTRRAQCLSDLYRALKDTFDDAEVVR